MRGVSEDAWCVTFATARHPQDAENWTRRMRNKLVYDPDDDKEEGGDGIFWMSFADFTGA